ncbi:Non-specific lipid-transfer protein [Melia azedarach]|uniref:Non-specific lipid-transfer protein n=1 Tax=Melia azedarach TaxID=155640 RepID=A0ACC1XLD6_MELAZ|nr:Non-specific lipid-transfer protein [Melia azedarach]
MNSSRVVVSAMAALILLLLFLTPESEAAISCSDVLKDLRPCVNYLKSGAGKPPAACCTGASALASAASSTADKKTACGCIKTAAQKINPNSQLAQALAGNCGISLPVPVSPNVDCSKVS